MANRPTTAAGIGQAFFFGYDYPDKEPDTSRCGTAASPARAAWAAGVDLRRADDKAKAKQAAVLTSIESIKT